MDLRGNADDSMIARYLIEAPGVENWRLQQGHSRW
jgi:hypothetical protein